MAHVHQPFQRICIKTGSSFPNIYNPNISGKHNNNTFNITVFRTPKKGCYFLRVLFGLEILFFYARLFAATKTLQTLKLEWNMRVNLGGGAPKSAPPRTYYEYIYIYLEPQTTIYKWLFRLDDSQSLHRKWLFHQTSIYKWLFGVPGIYIYISWQNLGPLLKVKLLVGPTCKIPRSTQRSG